MTEMKHAISPYKPATRSVTVTFTRGDLTHTRDVNAVLDASGEYDADATKARVLEVERGVAIKMGLGVLTPPEAIEPEVPAGDAEAEPEAEAEAE